LGVILHNLFVSYNIKKREGERESEILRERKKDRYRHREGELERWKGRYIERQRNKRQTNEGQRAEEIEV